MLDHHQAGVGHVHAHLDDGGGHQHAHASAAELGHHGRLLASGHAAVQQPHLTARQRSAEHGAQLGVRLGGVLQVQRLALFDQRAHPVDLSALLQLVADARDDLIALAVGKHLGDDGRAPGRQLVEGADGQVRKVGHGQGARDGRGAHGQQVGLQAGVRRARSRARCPGRIHHGARLRRWRGTSRGLHQLVTQLQPLRHAEAVLLVHHGQPQPGEHHVVLDHGVRAHHQPRLARGDLRQHRLAGLALATAGEPGHGDAQRLKPMHQLVKVLLGQDFGGRHERALPTGVDGTGGGQRGHHGLA